MKTRVSMTLLLSLFAALSLLAFQIPFIESSEVHDVAVFNVKAWPTLVLPTITVYINVTVENQGTANETFNLTVYADNLTIQTVSVADLSPGLGKTLTFNWEISPPFRIMIFPPPWPPNKPMVENVTIWAEADVVAGEVDTSDNIYIDGTVTIMWWPPDVNGDGKIDIRDIASVAKAFGSSPGDPRWDPILDFNSDGKIDIRDIATSAVHFGATYA